MVGAGVELRASLFKKSIIQGPFIVDVTDINLAAHKGKQLIEGYVVVILRAKAEDQVSESRSTWECRWQEVRDTLL